MIIRELKPGEPYPMDLLLLADPEEPVIRTYIDRCRCYVMEHEGVIAGVVALLPTRPLTVEIMNIAVLENMQGQGLGKRLLTHAIQAAKEQGCHTIEIGTGNSSVGQLHLYQRCGFRIHGVDMDYFVRNYEEPIYENGLQCRDMIRLKQEL
ncbi:GNAT family N-acetyltransferase [Paenibacillus sp. 32352]|uniref:GNAT family N-acetyltransferase n=1 Tax=Paenibacillus sp. 32352 TaxID=1969111 RepID=UPI0009ACE055|nr:GNAT family N-acetyltransferase [Paenibacillus sp. 32352]